MSTGSLGSPKIDFNMLFDLVSRMSQQAASPKTNQIPFVKWLHNLDYLKVPHLRQTLLKVSWTHVSHMCPLGDPTCRSKELQCELESLHMAPPVEPPVEGSQEDSGTCSDQEQDQSPGGLKVDPYMVPQLKDYDIFLTINIWIYIYIELLIITDYLNSKKTLKLNIYL